MKESALWPLSIVPQGSGHSMNRYHVISCLLNIFKEKAALLDLMHHEVDLEMNVLLI